MMSNNVSNNLFIMTLLSVHRIMAHSHSTSRLKRLKDLRISPKSRADVQTTDPCSDSPLCILSYADVDFGAIDRLWKLKNKKEIPIKRVVTGGNLYVVDHTLLFKLTQNTMTEARKYIEDGAWSHLVYVDTRRLFLSLYESNETRCKILFSKESPIESAIKLVEEKVDGMLRNRKDGTLRALRPEEDHLFFIRLALNRIATTKKLPVIVVNATGYGKQGQKKKKNGNAVSDSIHILTITQFGDKTATPDGGTDWFHSPPFLWLVYRVDMGRFDVSSLDTMTAIYASFSRLAANQLRVEGEANQLRVEGERRVTTRDIWTNLQVTSKVKNTLLEKFENTYEEAKTLDEVSESTQNQLACLKEFYLNCLELATASSRDLTIIGLVSSSLHDTICLKWFRSFSCEQLIEHMVCYLDENELFKSQEEENEENDEKEEKEKKEAIRKLLSQMYAYFLEDGTGNGPEGKARMDEKKLAHFEQALSVHLETSGHKVSGTFDDWYVRYVDSRIVKYEYWQVILLVKRMCFEHELNKLMYEHNMVSDERLSIRRYDGAKNFLYREREFMQHHTTDHWSENKRRTFLYVCNYILRHSSLDDSIPVVREWLSHVPINHK